MRRAQAVAVVMAVGLAGLGLAGCKSDNPTVKSGAGSGSTSSSSTSSTAAGSDATATSGPGPSCPATSIDKTAPSRQPRAEMTALRTGHEGLFDRVTFEFTGTSPGYRVGYIDKPVHEDGSGAEVPLKGNYALEVHMDNASGYHLAGDSSGPTYKGPTRVTPNGTTQVQEVARNGDFEGVLAWAIGVNSKVGFRVSRLDAPPRLVIDICAA